MRRNDSRGEEGKRTKKELKKKKKNKTRDFWGGRGRKRGSGGLVTVLSSSARNCCPEIRRTIGSCQDQHTHTKKHTHRACTQNFILHQVNTHTHTHRYFHLYTRKYNIHMHAHV